MMKLIHGIVAWFTAASARTPLRSVAARSASSPTMKPGSSSKLSIGRWNVSQKSMKRVIFSDAVSSIAPPFMFGLFDITPTG